MSLYKNRYESLIYWIAKGDLWSSAHPALTISTWMIMLSKGQKCGEGATEQDSGIWLCSRTQGHWAVVLNRMVESTSWRTSLLFMNGVWTSKDTRIHDLDGSFMACEVIPLLLWVTSSWFDWQNVKESMRKGLCLSHCGYPQPKRNMVILISFARGYSDTRELLGCCGSANWYMLSEVWYSRKGFFGKKKGVCSLQWWIFRLHCTNTLWEQLLARALQIISDGFILTQFWVSLT